MMADTDAMNSLQSEVTAVIAKQRFLRLAEGGRFIKYTTRGQKIKDKYWLCKLSPNHRALHYGDLEDSKDKTLDELPNRINVLDIKRILVGKDCPHMKDSHTKKATVDLAFTIVYESDHEDYLNFVAVDQRTFDHWIDGLNALIKAPMCSEAYHRESHMLTKILRRMNTMRPSTGCSDSVNGVDS